MASPGKGGDAAGAKPAPKRKGAKAGRCGPVVLTSHTLEAVKDTISEFYSRMPKGKCSNCGAPIQAQYKFCMSCGKELDHRAV